jgi:hypothetical protein
MFLEAKKELRYSDLRFLLKERIKPLVEALYDKLPWIWEVSLSRYWDRLIDFLDLIATYGRALKGYKQGFANKKGNSYS